MEREVDGEYCFRALWKCLTQKQRGDVLMRAPVEVLEYLRLIYLDDGNLSLASLFEHEAEVRRRE